MAAAYTFLRRAEHRLQLQRLRRTHLLPEDRSDMEWLARTDGYTASGAASAAEVFTSERVRHGATVRRLHEKLFYRPLLHAVAAVGTWARTKCGCPRRPRGPGSPRSDSPNPTPRCVTWPR